ncbi:urea transporter [Azonexus sp. IMCC34842]|uniref:urea transporter n=1 Tax=Azonexus sp. IMCC34842 TaxID=3420950 RepID=UPI003D10D477
MRSSSIAGSWLPGKTIRHGRWAPQDGIEELLRQLGYGLGSIFFISNPWIGLILWVALFANPRLGAFGVLGLGVGMACKRLLRLGDAPSQGAGIKANALLSAVATAWLTSAVSMPLWVQLMVAVLAAGTAAIVTGAAMAVLQTSRFPVMATGYCVVASCLFVLCPNCTVLASATMAPWLQPTDALGWLESFVRSMGGLVYSPSLQFGALVCLAMLLWSRAAFLTGVIAWSSGALAGLAFQALGFPYFFLPLSYNFFLVGIALGAVLFLPTRKTLLISLIAGVLCSFVGLTLQVVFAGGSISYLPISSMLTIWLGIGALMLAGRNAVAKRYSSSRFPPEVAWCRDTCLAQRFGDSDPLLAVPLSGPLRVSQGFAGGITHAGAWSHAFDFQRPASHNGGVGENESIWGATVLSPVAGTVERVRNDVPDNPLGGSNFADNWGNHVVIRLERDGWLLVAHLMRGSIGVSVGSRVEPGTIIGRVGNSGRSPEPHLHMQIQVAAKVGAPTKPFKLANYLSHNDSSGAWLRWTASGIPIRDSLLEAATPNPQVYGLLSTMMPGSAVWFCAISGEVPARLRQANADRTARIAVTLDEAGRYRFDAGKGGRLLASLDPDAWRITELERVQSSFLRLFGMATPCIPYASQVGMTWDDVPPLLVSGMGFADSLAPFFGKHFPKGHYECQEVPQFQGAIVIKASFESSDPLCPSALTCRFERLRGPVFLRAEYPSGAIEYSLLSFEPGLSQNSRS